MSDAVLAAALHFRMAGVYPLRVREDGSKAPWVSEWKHLNALPNQEDIYTTFTDAQGLGIITGRRSGGLELLEFEGRAVAEGVWSEVDQRMQAAKLGQIWAKLLMGYRGSSPSGGEHLLYFISDGVVPGNTKVAERPARDDELTEAEKTVREKYPNKIFRRTLIETRGEGGFVVAAPSGGSVHPKGGSWTVKAGGITSIPSITIKERNKILDVCRSADRAPKAKLTKSVKAGVPETEWERGIDWEDILGPHGWIVDEVRDDGVVYWRHPGTSTLHSATVGNDGKGLFVFSTSTEFEESRYYTKAEAYAILNTEGDAEAAREELGLRAKKPLVRVTGRDESELIDEIASHIADANKEVPVWFEYGNGYVEINGDRGIQPIDKDTIGYVASTAMRFSLDSEREEIAAPPVRVLTGMVLGRRLHLPVLKSIRRVPFFTQSGVLWQKPGYCEEAEAFYIPDIVIPPIPTVPGEEMVKAAREKLEKVVAGFPFDADHDKAAWYALLFHPFVRMMINGPTPLHLFGAPTPGTGKTLCGRAALHIAFGHSVVQGFPDDRFMESTLMANLMSGHPYTFYDNAISIKHPVFNAALTAYPNFEGRLLGTNTRREVPNYGAWLVSSNNPEVGREELRRSVLCWLDAKMEDPGERVFEGNLLAEIESDRKKLVACVLILIQNWIAKGRGIGKERLASFEEWSEVMGGICATMDLPSPVGDRGEMTKALDSESSAWKAFVEMWAEKKNGGAMKGLYDEPTAKQLYFLVGDLELPINGDKEENRIKSFGRALAKKRGQIVSGWRFSNRTLHGYTRYQITKVDGASDLGEKQGLLNGTSGSQ